MSTNKVSAKDIQRQWHLIDAKNKILGRLATEVATLLMGKGRPNYVPYLDMGDNIVVINAGKIKVTGRKEQQKKYVRHSGYPGGLKEETLEGLRTRKPEEVVIHAISGMIPKRKGDE
ncbi:MAG: Ribosomal protein L13 [Candidatus Daviesbacteria bacterium GW2011_GWA2_40_9]|uniref:Large ribosomal subunit protein uL13 n=1 Tax=Candidatus Daviesbacteria bacterium GW2011_GWA2_40_9 TaxID=1618424 RepID=A0A0G0WCY1_9BACT|nr:MAG: Ribosomal protein L13 [Candidatus Daviesbacteria bacterium GW2011_GWA2_40_9]